MTTLVLTAFTPALGTGRGARTYGVVAALARNGPVEVAYTPFAGDAPDAAFAALPRVRYTRLEKGPSLPRAAAFAVARARRVPADLARGAAPALAHAALAHAPGERIVADGPTVAAALLGVARRRPVVYCAHNLESSFRPDLPGEPTRAALERFERRVMLTVRETWMVSRRDVDGARALAPEAQLRLVPNVVDVAAITPVAVRPGARDVVFVGDLRYEPNRRAARFLVEEVGPALWRQVPDATLSVAGRGDAGIAADPRVRVLGFVDALDELYAGAGAVAVPLLEGGGSPLKFVEALARGVPVVATATAAAGLELDPGEHYLPADDAGAFADALAGLLREGPGALGHRARLVAEQRYSIEALAAALA